MNEIQNEITEKCYLIKNDISIKNEITPKVAADFSVTFYKFFKESYDEKLFINIVKKVMEFFNCAMADFPERTQLEKLKLKADDINLLKESLKKVVTLKDDDFNFIENNLLNEDANFYETEFKKIKKETNNLLSNKPFFLYKWSWKKKLKKKLIEVSILEAGSNEIYNSIFESSQEKSKFLENMFLEIKDNLKSFMIEVKPSIGKELADIPYEYVMENESDLKSFVFDVVIGNFYEYSTLKKK